MGCLESIWFLTGKAIIGPALAGGTRGGTRSTVFDIVLSPTVFNGEVAGSAAGTHTETYTSLAFVKTLVAESSIKVITMNTAEALIKVAGIAVEAVRRQALHTLIAYDVGP